MTIRDFLKNDSKDIVYDKYLRIVYDIKDYERITKNKMIDEILKEYSQEEYLYSLCTKRELDVLKKIYNDGISEDILRNNKIEMYNLIDKLIVDNIKFEIISELIPCVEEALKLHEENYNNESRDKLEEFLACMISKVKTNGNIMEDHIVSIMTNLTTMNKENIDNIMGCPLFHFYCDSYIEFVEFLNKKVTMIYYRDYMDILDELDDNRKIYGMGGTIEMNILNDFDIFYNGFPIRKASVKKMVDAISERSDYFFIMRMIDEARLLNDRGFVNIYFKEEPDLINIINEALDDCPCGAMNGFTPNDWKKETLEEMDLSKSFSKIPQNNAHLCKRASDEYYKIYTGLLEYINNKYNICKDIKKIYNDKLVPLDKIQEVDSYLWKNPDIIDDFINDNPYKFDSSLLDEVNSFKKSVSSNHFVVVGFDREYTKILSDDGKLYMVKGITKDIDKIISKDSLPYVVETTLIMFKGILIYSGIFKNIPLNFGNDIKKEIIDDMNNAIVYYHL